MTAPAAASAYSVSIAASADPAEERAITLTVSGVADAGTDLFVTRRAAGSQDCAATRRTDIGGADMPSPTVTGAFTRQMTFTQAEPGQTMICAWLQDSYSDAAARARAVPLIVTVRGNAASVSLAGPAQAPRAGEMAVITPTVQTEVPRQLTIYGYPAKAPGDTSACATSITTAIGSQRNMSGSGIDVSGLSATPLSWRTPAQPAAGGVWLLCAWVQEGYADVNAEAQHAMFLTVAPTVGCERAQKRLAAAQAAVRSAETKAKRAKARARRPAKRRVRAKRRAALLRAQHEVRLAQANVKRKNKRMVSSCD